MASQMTRTFILMDNEESGKIEVVESNQYLPEDDPLTQQISETAWRSTDDGADGTGDVICVGVFNEKTERWQVSTEPRATATES